MKSCFSKPKKSVDEKIDDALAQAGIQRVGRLSISVLGRKRQFEVDRDRFDGQLEKLDALPQKLLEKLGTAAGE